MMYLLKFKHSSICTHHEWFQATDRTNAKLKANTILSSYQKPYNIEFVEVGEVIELDNALQVDHERDWGGF